MKVAGVAGTNILTKFISTMASGLIIVLFLAQALPIVGTAGVGTLNYLFVAHFQKDGSRTFCHKKVAKMV